MMRPQSTFSSEQGILKVASITGDKGTEQRTDTNPVALNSTMDASLHPPHRSAVAWQEEQLATDMAKQHKQTKTKTVTINEQQEMLK